MSIASPSTLVAGRKLLYGLLAATGVLLVVIVGARLLGTRAETPPVETVAELEAGFLGKGADDVRARLGEPDNSKFIPATHNPTAPAGADNQDRTIWEYQSCHSLALAKQLYVCFDKDGRVYRVHGQR